MNTLFASPTIMLTGAFTGLLFGFLLQKGGVTRYEVIVGQFLLRDFTVLKVMMTAIVTGAIGIYGLRALGVEFPLDIKTAALIGNAAGGIIFGIGMVILGYCPGTGVAAIADGSRHAIAGVIGMIVGAGIYAEAHPWIARTLFADLNYEKATLASITGLSPWWFIIGMGAAAIAGFMLLERYERKGMVKREGMGSPRT